MTPEERQAALDNISPEDLEKIQRKNKKRIKVTSEDMLIAELAMLYGWGAYRDVKDNKISLKEMLIMIEAGRRLEKLESYDALYASYVGSLLPQTKNPNSNFDRIANKILKQAEADK